MRLGLAATAALLASCTVDVNHDLIKKDLLAQPDKPAASDSVTERSTVDLPGGVDRIVDKSKTDQRRDTTRPPDRRLTEPPPTSCTPQNCPDGCCEGNYCRPGATDKLCGKGGTNCKDCTANNNKCENQHCQ